MDAKVRAMGRDAVLARLQAKEVELTQRHAADRDVWVYLAATAIPKRGLI